MTVIGTFGRTKLQRLAWFCVVAFLACDAPVRVATPSQPGSAAREQAPRTLVVAIRGEPGTINSKRGGGLNLPATRRFFNADLALIDHKDVARPYLAEALPQLGTPNWQVFPDGKMETVYTLRPGLSWHDGAPLTSRDVAFAWRVYSTTPIGGFQPSPQNLIEDVVVRDERTIAIRWSRAYPEAGMLDAAFSPLPVHLLEASLRDDGPDSFANHAYWTHQFIGAGPFRLERWEPGSVIEGAAFLNHALGRPRVDRVRIQVISDPNTVVANLLAGAAHVALDSSIRFEQSEILRLQWESRRGGSILLSPTDRRFIQVQFRPELVNPPALLDQRVRAALAHLVDRQALGDALLGGQGLVMDSLILPHERWFLAVDAAVTRYPYDERRAEQLLNQAGYARANDGFYFSSGAAQNRLSLELRISAGGQNEQQNEIMADGWRRAGIEATSSPFPVALLQDGQYRASFPALQASVGGNLDSLVSATIPRPENRWQGSNRGGWSNPEYDRLYAAFNNTLDTEERRQQVVGAMKLISDELPLITLYYDLGVTAHAAALRGPLGDGGAWNIYEWELEG